MRITKILFLLMGTAISAVGHSQRATKFTLSNTTRTTSHSAKISSIDVTCNVQDSCNIGVLPSTISNTRNGLIVPEGIGKLLQGFVNKQYNSIFSPSGVGLLWDIRSFSVGVDSSNNNVISFVKIKTNVLKNGSSGKYEPLGSFDTLIVSKNTPLDLSVQTTLAIDALFDYSSLLVTQASLTNGIKKKISPTNDFSKNEFGENKDWKILGDTVYPRGLYMNFQEFKANTPSVTDFVIQIDSSTKQIKLSQFSPTDSSLYLLENVWGLSINNELYKYSNGQLYAIERTGKGFSLSKYLNFMTRKNQAVYWRRHIGNRQGNDNPFDDNHIYRASIKNDPSIKIETTKLDGDSGELTF